MTQSQRTATAAPAGGLDAGLKVGLVGGIVAVLIALQGMLQAFATRDIVHGVASIGQMLLFVTFFATAYVAISRARPAQPLLSFAVGAVAGLVSSGLLVLLIIVGSLVNLGEVFINATPQLYALVLFGQEPVTGSIFLLMLGLALGLIAAALYLLPSNMRGAVLNALVVVSMFGLLQDLIRVTASEWPGMMPVLAFLYDSNGLSTPGAAVLAVLIGAVSYLWSLQGTQVKSSYNALPETSRRVIRWSSIFLAIVILFSLPSVLGLYLSEVLDNVGLYLLMGLGLNIVVGMAGLLDLGYVAFFAIGAYTVGVLTSPELGRAPILDNWWLALPIGVAVAVLAGVALGIPVLKMRGDYLAIVTLGFGEIIRLLALSDLLKPFLGGAQGTRSIAKPDWGPLQLNWGPQEFYYLFLGGCLLAIFVAMRVKNSRLGRAWMAMREDEDVAQAMGINLVATKLFAFGMGAGFGGLSGAIFASKLGSIFPHSFNFLISIYVLSLIIIGGMGSIPGVIFGALALVGLPELLREVGDFRYLFFGAALVVMMLVRPEGLMPEARRKLELEEKVAEEGVPAQPTLVTAPGEVQSVLKTPGR